jgi:2'-hydroxyisoflavone reductase
MAEMLYGIRAVTRTPLSFCWVDAEFLAAHEVYAWQHMTTWVPPSEGYEGFSRVDCSRAIASGLRFRPLAETARDTLDWWNSLPEERRSAPRAGLPAEKETEVLAAWHARGDEAAAPAEQDDGGDEAGPQD